MLVHNRSNVVDFNFHLVLVAKYQSPVFSNAIYQQGIKAILQSIADNNGFMNVLTKFGWICNTIMFFCMLN